MVKTKNTKQPESQEKIKLPKIKWRYPILIALLLALGFGYHAFWNYAAERIADQYIAILSKASNTGNIKRPDISGFPGEIKLDVPSQILEFPRYSVDINIIHGRVMPVPRAPIKLFTGPIIITDMAGFDVINLDSFNAVFNVKQNNLLDIHSSALTYKDFTAQTRGEIDFRQQPFPRLNLEITFSQPEIILEKLADAGIIEPRFSRFIGAGLQTLANENGTVTVPVYQRDNTLYLGPLPVIMNLPQTYEAPEAFQADEPRLEIGRAHV